MGSFPVMSKDARAARHAAERPQSLNADRTPAAPGVLQIPRRSSSRASDDAPPRASLSTRTSRCTLVNGVGHSQTMPPDTDYLDLSSFCPCRDADNPIRVPCRCSTESLEFASTDAPGLLDKHSLVCIVRTPESAGMTTTGTDSLRTLVPHAVFTPRRGYIGDEINLVTPCDMDDFALASIGDTAAATAFPLSGTWQSGSGTAGSAPRLESKDSSEQVVDFVSFRRPGLKWCLRCQGELPPQSNFCPQCGQPTCAAVGEESLAGGANGSGWTRDAQIVSAQSVGSSSHEVHGYVVSFNTTSVTPFLETSASLKRMGSSRMSPTTPLCVRNVVNPALVSFKDEESSRHAYHARAYRRRIRMDLSSRGLLGRGAAGAVYRAFDVRNGQQMAVKVMELKTTDADDLAAIRNELRHLSRLRHRNIVEYFGCRVEENVLLQAASGATCQSSSSFSDVEEDLISLLPSDSLHKTPRREPDQHGMRIFILMERLECGSLVETLRAFEGGLPEMTVQVYAAQLVAVVLHVHQCGITHRDIKPANILLASDGTIKVADFGCAAVHAMRCEPSVASQEDEAMDASTHMDRVGKVAGTPAYMPPETLSILSDATHEPSMMALYYRAQDIWGLGCTVHQLLTGEEPWSSLGAFATPFALLMQIQGKSFPISPKVSGAAREFLELCFEMDPTVRIENSLLLPHHPFVVEM